MDEFHLALPSTGRFFQEVDVKKCWDFPPKLDRWLPLTLKRKASLHLKMNGVKIGVSLLGSAIFRGYVSFGECTFHVHFRIFDRARPWKPGSLQERWRAWLASGRSFWRISTSKIGWRTECGSPPLGLKQLRLGPHCCTAASSQTAKGVSYVVKAGVLWLRLWEWDGGGIFTSWTTALWLGSFFVFQASFFSGASS